MFLENRLLADDSHEISYLLFFQKLKKMSQILSSASVVIVALITVRDPRCQLYHFCSNHDEVRNNWSLLNKCKIIPIKCLCVCFVALRTKSTAKVMAGRSVHLTKLFPGQA